MTKHLEVHLSLNCGIIDTRVIDCHFLGFQDHIALTLVIFVITSLIVVLVFAGVVILFCSYAAKYKLTRRHHLKTICQTLTLLSFMTLRALIAIIGFEEFSYPIFTKDRNLMPNGWLIVTHDIAIPLSQILIPIGFLYCTVTRFECVSAIGVYLKKLQCSHSWHQHKSSVIGQAPPSTRVDPSSETYFETPYTGEFTSIADSLIRESPSINYGSGANTIVVQEIMVVPI